MCLLRQLRARQTATPSRVAPRPPTATNALRDTPARAPRHLPSHATPASTHRLLKWNASHAQLATTVRRQPHKSRSRARATTAQEALPIRWRSPSATASFQRLKSQSRAVPATTGKTMPVLNAPPVTSALTTMASAMLQLPVLPVSILTTTVRPSA